MPPGSLHHLCHSLSPASCEAVADFETCGMPGDRTNKLGGERIDPFLDWDTQLLGMGSNTVVADEIEGGIAKTSTDGRGRNAIENLSTGEIENEGADVGLNVDSLVIVDANGYVAVGVLEAVSGAFEDIHVAASESVEVIPSVHEHTTAGESHIQMDAVRTVETNERLAAYDLAHCYTDCTWA